MSSPSNGDVAEVEQLLLVLSSELPLRRLATVADENVRLRKENKDLRAESTTITRTIQRLQTDIDSGERESKEKSTKLGNVVSEKKELEAKLAATESSLRAQKKKVEDVEARSIQAQKKIKEDLSDKKAELERLSQLSVELKDVEDNEEQISEALSTIASEARKLVEGFFGVDVEVHAASALWSEVKGHISNGSDLPLPCSNSPLAKQMRVALVLSAVAHELCKHIFQPTYLLKKTSELNVFLKNLAKRNHDLESHLRSILLKAGNETENNIDSMHRPCVLAAFNSVVLVVSPLIPVSKREEFEKGLQNLCRRAYEEWKSIQILEDHVGPDMEPTDFSKKPDRWKSYTFTPPSPSQPTNLKQQRANGTAVTRGPSKGPQAASTQARGNEAPKLKDGIVVWPAFVNVSYPGEDALAGGLILPKSMIEAAEEEEQNAPPTSPTSLDRSHTEARDKKRRSSNAAPNGHANEGRTKGTFLSNGLGGGLRGA